MKLTQEKKGKLSATAMDLAVTIGVIAVVFIAVSFVFNIWDELVWCRLASFITLNAGWFLSLISVCSLLVAMVLKFQIYNKLLKNK